MQIGCHFVTPYPISHHPKLESHGSHTAGQQVESDIGLRNTWILGNLWRTWIIRGVSFRSLVNSAITRSRDEKRMSDEELLIVELTISNRYSVSFQSQKISPSRAN